MLRISQMLFCRQVLRTFIRCCNNVQSIPRVKVFNSEEENVVKISFKYGNTPGLGNINFQVTKEHTLQDVCHRINLMVGICRKKEELRRTAISKITGSGTVVEDDTDSDFEISVLKGDVVIEKTLKNVDAWEEGSLLKIGDSVFEIHYNIPTVVELRLPEYILSGCIVRPRFSFECTSIEDSDFLWFRSKSSDLENMDNNEENWTKVSEGFMYQTTSEDVGHKLKLTCTPKCGKKIGAPFTTISKNVVESGPEMFPFEERQQYTRELVDSDCIRCITYNVLANIYMEKRKFPYCSKKAMDSYYRKQILLKELMGYNCDILCLQEVQERVFCYDINPALKKVNMEGVYNKKGGRRYEGLACFYRPTKFKVLDTEVVYLNEVIKKKDIFNDMLAKISGNYKDMSKLLAQDTALQLVLLQHVEQSNKRVLVANTHLYSNKDTPEVRLFQAALCTFYSEHVLKSLEKEGTPAFIFCGDFNSLPNSAAHQFIQNGSFKCSSSWKNNSVQDNIDMTLRHNLSLDSACGTPIYTNYTETFNGCLDYIFYTVNDFTVTEVVPFPSHEKITEHIALPSELFPSDHIPLICTLKWRTWNDNVQ